jgi:hypothetical protein
MTIVSEAVEPPNAWLQRLAHATWRGITEPSAVAPDAGLKFG